MFLRIAFDLNGVLADFESVYRRIVDDLFGEVPVSAAPAERSAEGAAPGLADRDQPTVALPLSAWQEDEVWQEIEEAENFWMSLEPHEPGVLARIQDLATRHRWEVFFVTHRPATAGETVQRQMQRWLIAHGFAVAECDGDDLAARAARQGAGPGLSDRRLTATLRRRRVRIGSQGSAGAPAE